MLTAYEPWTSRKMKRCTECRNFLEIQRFVCLTYGFRIPTMTKHKQKQTDNAAPEILRSTGIDILEAALVVKPALAASGFRATKATERRALKQKEWTVSFEMALKCEAAEA